MCFKRLRLISIWVLLFFSIATTAFAQQSYKSVVPFLKGNKWGLVYHNGKQFYPPVFDEIFIDEKQYIVDRSIYFDDNNNKYGCFFLARRGNVYYKITEHKKLIKCVNQSEYAHLIKQAEANEVLVIEAPGGAVYNSKSSAKQEGRKDSAFILADSVRLKPNEDTAYARIYYSKALKEYKFFIHNKWIEEFTCNQILYLDSYSKPYHALLQRDDKTALVTLIDQKIRLPFIYQSIESIVRFTRNDSLYIVSMNNNYGVVDENNQPVIPLQYGNLHYVSYGKKDEQYLLSEWKDSSCILSLNRANGIYNWYQVPGVFNKYNDKFSSGEVYPYEHSDDYFIVVRNGRTGVIDKKGKTVIEFQYDKIKDEFYSEGWVKGFLTLENNNKKGWFGFAPKSRVEPKYQSIRSICWLDTKVQGLPVMIFQVKTEKGSYFVDNFGKEFFSK